MKGGCSVRVYGKGNAYAYVAGGRGMSVLSTDHAEWKAGGGACALM